MNELIDATNKLNNRVNQRSSTQGSILTTDEVQITVQFESDYFSTPEYKSFANERKALNSIEEVHEFRQRLNSFSKQYHKSIKTENISNLTSLDYNSMEDIEYSPYVVVNIDTNKISSDKLVLLAESNDIVSISVSDEMQPVTDTSWTTALHEMHAGNIVNSGTYTGEGIKIGIYEGKGICDISHPALTGKSITLQDSASSITNHATIVTSVLTAIAPDADYYVSKVTGYSIQWFIDNNCDIVNCSFGYYNNPKDTNGIYYNGVKQYRYDQDGVYDYQVLAHFITVVTSAGNYSTSVTDEAYNPENKISSPGYAYNVITVGGVKRTVTSSDVYLEHDSGPSYVTDPIKAKPNICAMYTITVPNLGTVDGTSVATPQVAGLIALLLESNASYSTYPERIMSLLMSTAQKTNDYVENVGRFNDKVGAGVIDLQSMIDNDSYFVEHNNYGLGQSTLTSINVSMEAGDELQVGLAWLVTAINNSDDEDEYNISNILMTDYDLRIYSPTTIVGTAQISHSNVEMIRLTAEETGTYRIVLYQFSQRAEGNDGDWIALTYNITH